MHINVFTWITLLPRKPLLLKLSYGKHSGFGLFMFILLRNCRVRLKWEIYKERGRDTFSSKDLTYQMLPWYLARPIYYFPIAKTLAFFFPLEVLWWASKRIYSAKSTPQGKKQPYRLQFYVNHFVSSHLAVLKMWCHLLTGSDMWCASLCFDCWPSINQFNPHIKFLKWVVLALNLPNSWQMPIAVLFFLSKSLSLMKDFQSTFF